MKPVAFEDLLGLPLVRYYESAFRQATGVSLKLVPPQAVPQARSFGPGENAFCALVGSVPAGCAACLKAEERAQHSVARQERARQLYCYTGMLVAASPVRIDGRHVATLLSGQVFRREPTERDFLMVVNMLGPGLSPDWVRKARAAYFATPVLTSERFQAVMQLLEVFAEHLADSATRLAVAPRTTEPEAIVQAKEFVQAHAEEPITLERVIEHVHVSRFYFCQLFKKATGLTLTEYIARVRVERAKALLQDPRRRISEVVFAAGFGSIPQFNSVFKTHVGMAPSDYRTSLRREVPN